MYAFEIVTIVVAVVAIALCFTRYFRVGHVLADLGRQGSMWFSTRKIAPSPSPRLRTLSTRRFPIAPCARATDRSAR